MLFGVASRTFVLLASMFICMYACVGIGNALVSTYSVNKPMAGDEDASVSRSAVCTSRLGDSWKEGGRGGEGVQRNSSIVHRSENKDAGSRRSPLLLPNDRAPFSYGRIMTVFPLRLCQRDVFNTLEKAMSL